MIANSSDNFKLIMNDISSIDENQKNKKNISSKKKYFNKNNNL